MECELFSNCEDCQDYDRSIEDCIYGYINVVDHDELYFEEDNDA